LRAAATLSALLILVLTGAPGATAATIRGTSGDDRLVGTPRNDTVLARGGDDVPYLKAIGNKLGGITFNADGACTFDDHSLQQLRLSCQWYNAQVGAYGFYGDLVAIIGKPGKTNQQHVVARHYMLQLKGAGFIGSGKLIQRGIFFVE
jgi:hypothetical protein